MEPEVNKNQYKRIFSVLFHLTKRVNDGAPLPALLQSVSKAAVELVEGNSCSILLLDESREELLCKAAHGLTPAEEEGLSFKVGEGVAGWVAERGAPALIADVQSDERFKHLEADSTPMRSMISVPLATKEGVIGVISVTSDTVDAFGRDHEDLLGYLGNSIVKDIENARLYRLSITDSLTKSYNRQYLFQRLPEEVERSRRYGVPLSLALFDIDHFKKFNDTYGHLAGDFVLKEVVRLAQGQIREVDALVRYGGEEFVVLLPNTRSPGALITAERLRQAVEAAQFPWSDRRLQVTVSIGISEIDADTVTDEQLLRHADEALYRAKQSGRNRSEVWSAG